MVVSSVLAMLQGSICLAVISAEELGQREEELIALAYSCEAIDAVAISTYGAKDEWFKGASVRNRKGGDSVLEIVEDLLSEDNEGFMISPWLPLTLVYLNGLVDLKAATEMFDERGWPFLVSVQTASPSDYILTKADFIRPAHPHDVANEPLHYVELDGTLLIADYEKYFNAKGVDLDSAVGFLNDR